MILFERNKYLILRKEKAEKNNQIHTRQYLSHVRELFRESKILNVFYLNVLKNLVVTHKIKSLTTPTIFQNKFRKPTQKCLTNFSTSNVSMRPFKTSLNTESQSESPHSETTFLQIWRKSKEV